MMSGGAVAAGHGLTARAAADVLQAGGNAFDAAISGVWMACVVEPVLASPGGGGFLMAHDAARRETVLYDFFVQTPLGKRPTPEIEFFAASADFGPVTQEFHIGHGATGTPGMVPGLFAVHRDLGSLAMADLLRPSIDAARDGVEITRFQAFLAQVVGPILTASETSRQVFAPDGALFTAGTRFANPALADFYAALASGGLEFYAADAVATFCAAQAPCGHLTGEDFARYRVEKRDPLEVSALGARIALNPPPSAGGAFIAHALTGLCGEAPVDAPALAHALAAADAARLRHRGDLRAMLGEVDIDVAAGRSGGPASRGTTHVSVVDAAGNAASATVSNGESNGHMVDGFGFMLNNMLGEEDVNPGGFHRWRENARLASNMCPAIARAGDGTIAALGSGGSNRIRSAVFQVLARLLAGGLAAAPAVEAARLHVEAGHLDFEDVLDAGERDRLCAGFDDRRAWPEPNLFFGGAHAALRAPDGTLDAAGDPRRGGEALVL